MDITLDSIIPQNLTAIIYVPGLCDVERERISHSSLEIIHYDRNRPLVNFVDRIWEYVKLTPFKKYIDPEITILFNGQEVHGVWEEFFSTDSPRRYEQVQEEEYKNIVIHKLIFQDLSARNLALKIKQAEQQKAERQKIEAEKLEQERQQYERLKRKFDKPEEPAKVISDKDVQVFVENIQFPC